MAKRKPLSFNNEELTKNLKESAGKGLDAFFSPTPPPHVVEQKPEPVKEAQLLTEIKQASKQESNIASNIAGNITILQFTDDEIEKLREPAYKAQTFRLTEREVDWVKDTSYRLSKEIKRGKVSQADILRISFKLFSSLLATNKGDLIKILQQIK
jgi:Rad3-related DNA helicase